MLFLINSNEQNYLDKMNNNNNNNKLMKAFSVAYNKASLRFYCAFTNFPIQIRISPVIYPINDKYWYNKRVINNIMAEIISTLISLYYWN